MVTSEDLKNIAAMPIGSYIGGGNPIFQNTAGFPSGVSGSVPIESNIIATAGPDPIDLSSWPWTGQVTEKPGAEQNTIQTGRGTVLGDQVKKLGAYTLGIMLLAVGLIYLLWSPAKKVITETAEAVT